MSHLQIVQVALLISFSETSAFKIALETFIIIKILLDVNHVVFNAIHVLPLLSALAVILKEPYLTFKVLNVLPHANKDIMPIHHPDNV